MTTSRTRNGTKEYRLYQSQAQPLPRHGKLPTQKEVSLAVSFELQNTEADFNLQEKTAVSEIFNFTFLLVVAFKIMRFQKSQCVYISMEPGLQSWFYALGSIVERKGG